MRRERGAAPSRVERKDGGGAKKGEERRPGRKRRPRFRLALLHNFIVLSPVFAAGRE